MLTSVSFVCFWLIADCVLANHKGTEVDVSKAVIEISKHINSVGKLAAINCESYRKKLRCSVNNVHKDDIDIEMLLMTMLRECL